MAKIVSFSLNAQTLGLMDKIEGKFEFKNRSELIRAALQLLLNEVEDIEKIKGHMDAIIAVTHVQGHDSEISRIRHQFNDIVTTQIHNNLHGKCMELFIVHGKGGVIVEFFKALKKSKDVEYAKMLSTAA